MEMYVEQISFRLFASGLYLPDFYKRNEVGSRRKSLLSEGGLVNDITAGREREQAQKCVLPFVNDLNFMKSTDFSWVFLSRRFISNFAVTSR